MQAAFKIGSIPVRIHASFLITALLLGAGDAEHPELLILWFVIVLVSVLIHELGHALVGKLFDLSPEIDLHAMGGTTSWRRGRNVGNGKSILISLAGPAMGLAAGLALLVATWGAELASPLASEARGMFLLVNIGWGIFNLVPMLPLDGGNVMRSTLNAMTSGKGEGAARIISIVLAVLIGIGSYAVLKGLWIPLLCGLFAFQNVRAYMDWKEKSKDEPLRKQLDEAYAALQAQDAQRVIAFAQPVANAAKSGPVRAEAVHLLAYGLLLAGRVDDADATIASLPAGFPAHPAYAELRAHVVGQIAQGA